MARIRDASLSDRAINSMIRFAKWDYLWMMRTPDPGKEQKKRRSRF